MRALSNYGWLVGLLCFLAAIAVVYLEAPARVGVPLPGDEKNVVPAFGEAGYTATEEFCRDSRTQVKPTEVPERSAYELIRVADGIQESMLVVIVPATGEVEYAKYDNDKIDPTNVVIDGGARKCLQEKAKSR